MNKKIYILCKIMFIFLLFRVWTSFASTNVWEFDVWTDYTLSNSTSFNFTTSVLELNQNTLNHSGKINNAITYNGAYDLVVEGNYAYMTNYLRDSVSIIDISNPTVPILVTEILNNAWTIRLDWASGLVKDGNYLYVASNVSDALQIINVTNPALPTAAWQLLNTTTTRLNWARWIDKVWNYVYIVSDTDDSLTIVDVTNPLVPIYTWKYYVANWNLNWARDVKIAWNYAYISNFVRDSFAIINITNPLTPTFVSEILDATNLNWAHNLELNWNYAYVSAYDWARVSIINISDPLLPTISSTLINWWNYNLTNPRDLLIAWNKLFITSFWLDTVNVVDITNPAVPVYITKIIHNAANPLLDWVDGIFKVWNYIYTAVYNSDALEILKFNYDITSPFVIPNTWVLFEWNITSLNEILTPSTTWNITYQLSKDNWTTWYYWNWSSWVTTIWWTANSNSISVINSNLSSLNTLFWWIWVFKYKAFLNSNWDQIVWIDSFSIQTSANQFISWFSGRYYTWTAAAPFTLSNLKLIRNDTSINFNWWTLAPHVNLPADGFTARWTWKITTDITWVHTFRTNSDDWVRLYVNWTFVINWWVDQSPTYRTWTISLTAWNYYDIVVEYYENWWGAVMQLDWLRPWDITYSFITWNYIINNTTYTSPTDILLSNSTVFHLDWIWTTVWNLSSVDLNPWKTFTYSLVSWIWSEDNSSFYITWNTIYLNETADSFNQDIYSIRIRTDDWEWWVYEKVFAIFVVNLSTLNPWFCSSYYNWVLNPPFSPSLLLYKSATNNVNFNWWTLSPDPSVPADYFTSSYEWYIETSETWVHTFRTNSDDWVRLYIDWNLIIDNWTNHGPTYNYWTYTLTTWNFYHIRLEFYENTWWAVIQLDWLKPSDTIYSNINQSNVWHIWSCITTDNVNPVFTYSTPILDSSLIPWKNLNISLNYNDWIGWSWIDTSTWNFTLFKWNWTSWWSDISPTYLSWSTINALNSNFNLINLPYWKYNYIFTIDDNNWNTWTISKIFYMDEPSFNVSTSNYTSSVWASYWVSEILVTINTVWAAYNIELLKDSSLIDSRWNTIIDWNGSFWLWYDIDPYSWPKKDIPSNPIVWTRTQIINTNWDLNTYIHRLKIKSLVTEEQAAGNYEMDISFRTIFSY